MEADHIAGLLRKLSPWQEKIVRLYFGLGCERPHAAGEIGSEFGVSAQAIAGTIRAALRRLAPEGLTSRHLREAARDQAENRQASQPLANATGEFRRARHSHRR